MGKRTVQEAVADDIQKRRFPTKHYVFVIHVSWTDGSVNVVYRRYSKFFDFQIKLLSLFPEEAGARNPTQRMIPFLPGKKLFGRSHVREVASKRLGQLNEYCQSLVRLPPKISECDEVLQFFTPTTEDINPTIESSTQKKGQREIDVISDPIHPDPYIVIADYKKQQKNEVELHAGDSVEVFEKSDNGWWFVSARDSQGWAPATFLSTADGKDEDEETISGCDERFISNNSYKAQQEDEITFEAGVVLSVMQKSMDGWWMARYNDKVGWVPAAFLQVYTGPADVAASTPTQRIGNIMSVSDIMSRSQAAGASKDSPKSTRREYTNILGTEAKPTPPRRSTVRKSATRKPNPPAKKKVVEYYTVADFSDIAGDSISFQSGQKVQVIQESDSGWWLVKIGDKEGWAPYSYIEAREVTVAETRPPPPSTDTLDEETGESSPRLTPSRPPPPSERKSSGGTAFKPALGNNGGFRPVPIPASSIGNGNSSAFRPVPIPVSERPLPIAPALQPIPKMKPKPFTPKTVGSPDFLLNAQANLKPSNRQDKPPPVINRNNKPGINPAVKPALKPRSPNNLPSQVNELKDQLQSLNTQSAPRGLNTKKAASTYATTAAYKNSDDFGLSFEEGVAVEVIEKTDSGWWLVRIGGQEGWAPSTYLEKS